MSPTPKSHSETIKTLFHTASILQSRRFADYVLSTDSMIHPKAAPFYFELDRLLKYQVDQSHSGLSFSEASTSDLHTGLKMMAGEMIAIAENMLESESEPLLKKYRTVKIPKDNAHDFITKTLSDDRLRSATADLASMDITLNNKTFGIRNTLSSLATYITAKDTLTRGAPENVVFDHLVKDTLNNKDPKFVIDGYIHDLLAHDRMSLTSSDAIGIAMRQDYLSTYLVTRDNVESFTDHPDFDVTAFPTAGVIPTSPTPDYRP